MWLSELDKKTFQAIILLNELVNGHVFKTVFNGDDKILEPLFVDLMTSKNVEIKGDRYVITEKGKKGYNLFMDKYYEYLKVYDIYSFIDLDKAEFAFSKFFDFSTDSEWNSFKNDTRFQDIRIAVGLYKKINVAEFVFMSFINEDRFNTEKTGWQIDLISGIIWDEIEKICETAIKPEQLGDDAMKDIIQQGSCIMVDLIKKETEQKQNDLVDMEATGVTETITETTTEVVVEEDPDWIYYEAYYDPFYVPLFWYDPIIIW